MGCVLHIKYNVLWCVYFTPNTVYYDVCIAHQVQCTMVCVLHTKYSVLLVVYCTLNIVYYGVCIAHKV